MKNILKKGMMAIAMAGFALSATVSAGPILISGTDSDDHGFFNGTTNQSGWKFVEAGIRNVGGGVTNGQNTAVCIGCNGSSASGAFNSGFSLSGLAGWTNVSLTSTADITAFFDGTGAVNINNAGMIYMPTVANNVGGGITDTQLAIVNANGLTINNYVAGGGGLFTQEQANSGIGYGWLLSLIPGITINGDNVGGVADSSTINLTAAGSAAFPLLTSAEISAGTPWHAYFGGNFGGLSVLAVGNGDNQGGFDDAVVLGGGGGTVILCGTPNTPPCPTPLPAPITLIPVALLAAGWISRKKA
jgi:hypothetical protein